MPYGEKLKLIKKDRKLTNAKISEICDVALSTVTRVFDEKTPSGNFETFVALARGIGFSLDELAGLKPPVESPNLELLNEKNAKIEHLSEEMRSLREDVKMLREDNKHLRDDNKSLRRGKFITIGILALLVIALSAYIIYDLLNGHLLFVRY